MPATAGHRGGPRRRAAVIDREPLSWQQEGRLLRDTIRGERVPNIVTAIPLPKGLDDGEVRDRLNAVVAREDALRTVELSLDDGARYDEAVDVALPVLQVADPDELARHVRAKAFDYFGRGGLLWDASLLRCMSDPDGPGRYLCTSFDHLITDGYSQALFLEQLTAPNPSSPGGGSFREWTRWQRSAFPRPQDGRAASHGFWAKRLGGREPDRPVRLSFCTSPGGELSGTVHSLRRQAPVSATTLTRAAARARTTPFVLFLGVVAHTATLLGSEPDLTLRVNTAGRPTTYLDTQGFFSDNLPVRLDGPALADPLAAVRAARAGWLRIVPHQTTPWDYLLAAFGRPSDPDDPASLVAARPAQALVNFLPWQQPAYTRPAVDESEYPSAMGTFQAVGAVYDDNVCQIECEFDPVRFDRDGAVEFIEALASGVGQVCGRLVA